MKSYLFKTEENPYYKNFRIPKRHSKSIVEIEGIIENLYQRFGNEIEMIQYWYPLLDKPLSNADNMIVCFENAIAEKSVKHILFLSEATLLRIWDKIDYWEEQLLIIT